CSCEPQSIPTRFAIALLPWYAARTREVLPVAHCPALGVFHTLGAMPCSRSRPPGSAKGHISLRPSCGPPCRPSSQTGPTTPTALRRRGGHLLGCTNEPCPRGGAPRPRRRTPAGDQRNLTTTTSTAERPRRSSSIRKPRRRGS